MLIVPRLAGVLVTGLRWPHLPLLGAWWPTTCAVTTPCRPSVSHQWH
ncbi:hypothetical protein O7629_13340 [Solwaraspora sp. WMMD792]|nr:hypothetical protein [Solwaraspora sp. WMMD792]MDG4771317.1 hypothetical protein [Solwaraspora sp. WMMD792]